MRVSVSLWSADLADLASTIARLNGHTDAFHIDVADAHYVPTLLFGPDTVRACRRRTRLPLDVHLMVANPDLLVDAFLDAGADWVAVHPDACPDPAATLRAIRAGGARAGLALAPDQPLDVLVAVADLLDHVILLGTAPGIKGSGLLPEAPRRLREARALLQAARRPSSPPPLLVADGGIRRETAPLLAAAGADWVTPGSLVLGVDVDPIATLEWLHSLGPAGGGTSPS
jgi:ribulose-phosphate 3-epimerase